MIKICGRVSQEQLKRMIKEVLQFLERHRSESGHLKPEKLIEVYEKAGTSVNFS